MTTPPYEQFLLKTVVPDLEQGRPGWDLPHTLKVVEYVKVICDARTDIHDPKRHELIVAAYLHDYGYMYFLSDLLSNGPTTGRAKREHAAKSAEKWQEIQSHEVFCDFTSEQKERIEHLIRVHDEVYDLQDVDELLLMEADTLGALGTTSEVDTTLEPYQHYLRATQDKRIARFITPYAIKESERLMNNLLTN